MSCMSQFVESEKQSSGFELCGRMIRENDSLVVFIDGVGRFEIPGRVLIGVLAGLGDEELSWGRVRLSESGRGSIWISGWVVMPVRWPGSER